METHCIMKDKPENPQAFPRNGHPDKNDLPHDGMLLRDYFAAKTLQGLVSRYGPDRHPEWYTARAYDIADAMLAERSKSNE